MVPIYRRYMTNNDCYKRGRKMNPKGAIVHLTATSGVDAKDWFSRWDKPGVKKCVHAFIDPYEIWQYLPWDMQGWHAGGSANNNYIGLEGCEPRGHYYKGSTPINYDVKKNADYFAKMYNNMLDMCVILCKRYGWTEKNFFGHDEAYKMGIASNSADPTHIFRLHNKSMNIFRADLRKKLQGKEEPNHIDYTVVRGDTLYSLAGKFGTTIANIKEMNNLKSNLIKVGDVIKINGNIKDNSSNTIKPPINKPKLVVDGLWGPGLTRELQKYFGTIEDGVISGQYKNNVTTKIYTTRFGPPYTGSNLIRALQRKVRVREDGYIGQATIRALQNYLNTPIDGVISRPSLMVKEMQRRLNNGTF